MPPWVWQNGQWSKALTGAPCAGGCGPRSTLTIFRPAVEQISAHSERDLPASDSACEIDGTSAADRITRQANAAVMRLLSRERIVIPKFYHAKCASALQAPHLRNDPELFLRARGTAGQARLLRRAPQMTNGAKAPFVIQRKEVPVRLACGDAQIPSRPGPGPSKRAKLARGRHWQRRHSSAMPA